VGAADNCGAERTIVNATFIKILLVSIVAMLSATAADAAPEPAQRADDFVDRIGVATHWGYPDTPYGYAYEQVKKLLGESGIHHVRDGWHPREVDLYDTYGIKTTLIVGPGGKSPVEKIAELAPHAHLISMIEGPNEVDIFATSSNYQGKTFPEGAIAFQDDLYAAVKANPATAHLGVIAPSTARRGSNQRLAPLKSLDYLVMHPYAGGGPPGGSLEGDFSNILEASRILGPGAVLKPIVVTESGYHTALESGGGVIAGVQPAVSEKAHAKYIPRHYAEYFNAGIVRTIVYEFINEFKNEATNAEASFGLVRRDLTPKPAYHALKNLISLLSEARWNTAEKRWEKPTFAPGALDFELGGDLKNVHHTLLQKSNGDFYLLLWQEVSSFDTKNKKDIENPTVHVTLNVKTPLRSVATYLPGQGREALQILKTTGRHGFEVPDEVLVVQLEPKAPRDDQAPALPADLAATATGTSITLKWSPAPDNKKVETKGYFVSRLGRYLGRVTETSFTDTRLLPDTGYTYEVRSYDAAGNVSPPATTVVMTRAEYPDLIVTDVSWTPANPKAGDAVQLSATIKNIGNGAAPVGITHGIAFHIDGTFVNWSDTLNQPLAPGETRTLAANNGPKGTSTWLATAGQHSVEAHVDDVNRINESDETNNKLSKSLTVGD
ncbi:MAG: hypothetical protein M3347_08245, partial [Armatimonadota bacterium]|nr:hypothetical protein [Armatimonadota bacterium]